MTLEATPSSTAEDYLKVILEILRIRRTNLAPMGEVTDALALTPGTVTTMIRRLASDGLAVYEPRKGCGLTDLGRTVALRTLRRHRVLETFLVSSLGMDWSEVHREAEKMEHGVSDSVIDKLWDFLGRPARDPHGGIIPDGNLALPSSDNDVPVSGLINGTQGVITRLPDRDPALLKALHEAGLAPGACFTVVHQPGTGTLELQGPNDTLIVSKEISEKIRAIRSPSRS